MLSQTERPQKFSDVAGQQTAVQVLRAIIKNPKNAPRSLIFGGEFGTGKTTLARIFARALNCKTGGGEACGTCENCRTQLDNSPFYLEFDSAVVGNVESIRELRDVFQVRPSGLYRVIVLDECHVASRAAQTALLKCVEEAPEGIFYVFATTDPEKILPTIRSRSMELRFDLVRPSDMLDNVTAINLRRNLGISPAALNTVVARSRGHMRNAHMLLDQCALMGESEFLALNVSAVPLFIKYFHCVLTGDKEKLFLTVGELERIPVADLYSDYQEVIYTVIKGVITEPAPGYEELIKLGGIDLIPMMKGAMGDWVRNSFSSDVTMKAALLALYQMLSSRVAKQAAPQPQQSVYGRAAKS